MQPRKQYEGPDLFRSHLEQILNRKHPLFVLADRIDWTGFEEAFDPTYVEETGRAGLPRPLGSGCVGFTGEWPRRIRFISRQSVRWSYAGDLIRPGQTTDLWVREGNASGFGVQGS